jgi:HK97 family phage major capsid protein
VSLNRAYSLITVKDFDPVKRTFAGIATSPVPDRIGDVIERDGIQYKNPLPLLLYHNATKPVGEARFGKSSDDGVPYDARISTIDRESGVVKERLDEAVDSLAAKPPLIRGVSIGFVPLEEPEYIRETGGFRYTKIEVLELSMVVIPAHQDATIELVKSLDDAYLAALGTGRTSASAGATASREPTRSRRVSTRSVKKTIAEQIAEFEGTRETARARMNELATKSAEEGVTLDKAEEEEYDRLDGEIETINKHVQRLQRLEEHNKAAAVPATGATAEDGTKSRGGHQQISVSQVKQPPGIGFARAVKAILVGRLDNRSPLEVAKEMYPSDARVHTHLTFMANLPNVIAQIKAAVPAATSTHATWAGALVDPTNLAAEFIEFLRPATIIGKLNLRSIPFNVRMIEQTQGGTGYWVGQGAPKPLTAFGYAPVTLGPTKVAAIAVATEEAVRLATPSLDQAIRDSLRDALVERIDRDLLDPAEAGSTNVQPASLTNGVVPLTSAGASADNVRTDLGVLVRALRSNNLRGPIAIVMPDSLVTALTFMTNALGQPEFPGVEADGGTVRGLRIIGSEYVANASGAGNMVVAIAEREVFLADDGQVTVDASREASLQMLDNPTNNSATATATTMVSMWQTNSVAFRAERWINWLKRRSTAVAYIDDVNWGSVGSPS